MKSSSMLHGHHHKNLSFPIGIAEAWVQDNRVIKYSIIN